MTRKLLDPLDGTPEAASALVPACTLARQTGAVLELVRVVAAEEPAPDLPGTPAAASYLEHVAEPLARDGLRVISVVRRGAIPDEIVRESARWGANAIVMATHAHHGLRRAGGGSVADDVLQLSSVPVLLSKPGGQPMRQVTKLLVPVDGTPGGLLALERATELARAASATVVLLRVVVPIPAYLSAVPVPARRSGTELDEGWDAEALASAQRFVDGLAGRLQSAGIQAEPLAVMGSVTDTIVDVARRQAIDLIVMSTHALTGPARTLLGSVANAVVRTSDRPVLLVRRDVPHHR